MAPARNATDAFVLVPLMQLVCHKDRVANDLACFCINDSNLCTFVHHILDAVHWQREVLGVVARKCDVDVHDQGDKPARHGERPPSIGIVVYAHLVKQWRGYICPQYVHEKRGRAAHVDREAIVLVRGDFRRGPRDCRRIPGRVGKVGRAGGQLACAIDVVDVVFGSCRQFYV